MSDRSTKRESGFSLLEMTVSMALGTIVLGAAVQIYIQGVSATWTVSQRAEMQQDFRAASNISNEGSEPGGRGPRPGCGDRPGERAYSEVWLRSDGEVLHQQRHQHPDDISPAGRHSLSLRAYPGI
jgi:prepilin-type N-terminal cleavage/methylation domain-containing protein